MSSVEAGCLAFAFCLFSLRLVVDISTGHISTIAKDTPRAFKVAAGFFFVWNNGVAIFKSKRVAILGKMSTNLVRG